MAKRVSSSSEPFAGIASPRPTAKRLILSLLSAPSMDAVRIGLLVKWGALFEIDGAAVRVAAGRLARQGLLASPERGVYTIGPEGLVLARTARSWMNAEARVRPWASGWLFVHTAGLGRTDKSALRRRERALRLRGFAEPSPGLWCRPDNLSEPLEETRETLVSLGLESSALLLQAGAVLGIAARDLAGLWPRAPLEAAYRAHLDALAQSRRRVPGLAIADAARETFLVGEAVIRLVNADPLLPAELVDTQARRALIDQMVEYNALGESVWSAFSDGVAGS